MYISWEEELLELYLWDCGVLGFYIGGLCLGFKLLRQVNKPKGLKEAGEASKPRRQKAKNTKTYKNTYLKHTPPCVYWETSW